MLQFDPAYIDMALSSWLDAIHLDFRAWLGLDEFTVLYHISTKSKKFLDGSIVVYQTT